MHNYLIVIFISFITLCYLLKIKKIELGLNAIQLQDAVIRLKNDFYECKTIEQLKRLEKFIPILVKEAKKITSSYLDIERDLVGAYISNYINLQ